MKKRNIGIVIILTSLILTFGFSSNVFAEDLIHGVVPTKVTGHDNIGALEFWNVGKLGGEQYSKATYTITWEDPATGKKGVVVFEGYFTGGPNGKLFLGLEGQKMNGELVDGKVAISDQGGETWIDNPEAFDGWDGATYGYDDETSHTAPTIQLLILEGPVNLDGGNIRYKIKIQTSGNPEPIIEYSEAFVDSTTPSDAENVVNIIVQENETLEFSATATNSVGSATASISLVGTPPVAPKIKLILKGPEADEDGSNYSFIIEAKVTGNPAPEINFSRDDSDGSMGANKAMITLPAEEKVTVEVTATNSLGKASESIEVSTMNFGLKLDLKIIEGPVWVNIESAYYIIEAVVKGFPVPDVVWECPRRFIFWPAGNNKKKVYVKEEGDFARALVTAYAKNSIGQSEKKEIWLEWVAPPANMFTERTFTIVENYKMKGKLFVKRAGEHNWVEVNQTLTLFDGDDIKTDNAGAAIIASDLKGHLVLGPNASFSVGKGDDGKNIIISNGDASFKIMNPKNNSENNFIIQNKFGNAKPTGTDFIINANENQTVLKVIDGTVEFTSTVSDESIIVNPGESVIATEKGLGEKTNFDIPSEEKYWNAIEGNLVPIDDSQKNNETAQQKNQDNFFSSLQNYLNKAGISNLFIILIGIFLILGILTGLVFIIIKTRKK